MASEGRWLPVHVITVQGQQQELVLKANVFQDEGVWWDLYEPLHYLVQNKALKIGKVLGKDMHELVTALGGLDGRHVSSSRRASRNTDSSQEYTVDTYGLLHLLLWFWRKRRYVADQERGKALLEAFLCAALDGDLSPQPTVELPLELRTLCQSHVTTDGCCEHISQSIAEARELLADLPPQHVTVKWVKSLASLVDKCAACKPVLDHILFEASLIVDMAALLGDLASSDVNESIRGRQVQQQKRRRIDEHVRQHLLASGHTRHESSSSSGTRLMLHAGHNVKASWIARKLRQQLEHLWSEGAKSSDLVIAMDGVRIGRPGEETYCYIAWLPHSKAFCHLPPQCLNGQNHHSCACAVSTQNRIIGLCEQASDRTFVFMECFYVLAIEGSSSL
eukprot:5379924-Amphidinium_carterae.1